MEEKYRVVVGASGDDFVYADGLTYDEASKMAKSIPLNGSAYAYVESDN